MKRNLSAFVFFTILMPFAAFAQITISGKILNHADTRPVANVSVFLSNSTTGDKTSEKGIFNLQKVKPGKYKLVVSSIGFVTYSQQIIVNQANIQLPDIEIFPKTILLSEVKIHSETDPDRQRNYEWFKNEFLGTSERSANCKILNPEILDLSYNNKTNTLTASSSDFLIIENPDLGYRIKYLLTDFLLTDKDGSGQKIHFEGSALFEELKGTPSMQKRWQRHRQEVYVGSAMHFLRSALNKRIRQEGFRVLRLMRLPNPERPADSLIEAKIKYFKTLKAEGTNKRDSLAYWNKKLMLPKIIEKFMTSKTEKGLLVKEEPLPLISGDIIKPTDQPGLFAFGVGDKKDALFITYNKHHNFYTHDWTIHLNDPDNRESTLINFKDSYALFDTNGNIVNPNSLEFSGVWGRNRVAELLPVDYKAVEDSIEMNEQRSLDSTISKLNNFTSSHITEKAYLHFDKPYYAVGDTIYFKAYLTMGEKHEPSNISGVLHADLISPDSKVEQSIKLQVKDGVAWGDFALPDSLPKGNYQVRAYTLWMQNEGENGFFYQTISIGSLLNNKIPESGLSASKATTNKAAISFLPEGGNMVAGICSKLAFKAIGTNELGINVKGEILDNNNREVTSFSSLHAGMGYCYITPENDKIYIARITYADGSTEITELPKAEESGITLSINNDSIPKATIKITANKLYYQENKDKKYSLFVSAGEKELILPCTLDSNIISLDILKRHLPTGIATATLFSPTGESLCERLFFVQSYDQLNLEVSSDKTQYNKREKVTIQLKALTRADSAARGHFSVSVIDESKVPVSENAENTILADLLLTSDLKGYVEQPNYYFTSNSSKTKSDLDLVMLTHGYRRFEWNKLLNNEYPPITYQPEIGLDISGIATTLGGRPVVNGTVSLISSVGGPLLINQTDNTGNFHFTNLVFNDTTSFILNATKANGKNLTKIKYKEADGPAVSKLDLQPDNSQSLTAYMENKEKQQEQLSKYGLLKGKLLKEVTIKAKRVEPVKTNSRYGTADHVVTGKQIGYGGMLRWKLAGLVHFPGYFTQPPLIVIDGVEMPLDFNIDDIRPGSIQTLEVFTNATSMGPGYQGILSFTTNFGQQAGDMVATGFLPIKAVGFYKARQFYSPQYKNNEPPDTLPDLRTTIYWNPELITDKNGNASFDYYNADGRGNYRIVIEGIDEKGNIGRQVYKYKVK